MWIQCWMLTKQKMKTPEIADMYFAGALAGCRMTDPNRERNICLLMIWPATNLKGSAN